MLNNKAAMFIHETHFNHIVDQVYASRRILTHENNIGIM